jgi:tRNA pseudouridine55 synthase
VTTVPAGLLVVDKAPGWTSHDVVARVRRLAGTRKVGHAGTLDPMATGVLVLGIGSGTRLLTFLVGCDKAYSATIRLGQGTVTDDAEGEVTEALGATGLDLQMVDRAAESLRGAIQQVPSSVSAIKVDGQRSYARVRGGEDVTLPPRPVVVHRFDLGPLRTARASDGTPVVDLDVEVEVSSGTYVRALARDLGSALGVGGHLVALRRTRVGAFTLDQAAPLLSDAGDQLDVAAALIPLAQAARTHFPAYELDDEQASALSHGRTATVAAGEPGLAATFAPSGALVAVVEIEDGHARPKVVFAPG